MRGVILVVGLFIGLAGCVTPAGNDVGPHADPLPPTTDMPPVKYTNTDGVVSYGCRITSSREYYGTERPAAEYTTTDQASMVGQEDQSRPPYKSEIVLNVGDNDLIRYEFRMQDGTQFDLVAVEATGALEIGNGTSELTGPFPSGEQLIVLEVEVTAAEIGAEAGVTAYYSYSEGHQEDSQFRCTGLPYYVQAASSEDST